MSGNTVAADSLESVVLEALVAAEIARTKLYRATRDGSNCDGPTRQRAYRLERRLNEHTLFEPSLHSEIAAMATTLSALSEHERDVEVLFDEGCISGSYESLVYTDQGYSLLEAVSALEVLSSATSAVRKHVAAERLAASMRGLG